MHYDRELADLYKNMNKAEKEALWADDRSCQHLLAMQACHCLSGRMAAAKHHLKNSHTDSYGY